MTRTTDRTAPSMVSTKLGRLAVTVHRGDPARLPLVLGHGIFFDSTLWDDVVSGIDDRTVVAVEGPGHGGSDQPPRGWTLDEHVIALGQILDQVGVERAVVAGHSWGGMMSLRLALAQPDRVAGLGLVNTPLLRTHGATRLGFRAQQAMLRLTGATAFYARQAVAALYDPRSLDDHPGHVDAFVARSASARSRPRRVRVRAILLEPTDHLDRLGEISVPTAVVAGTTDYVFPPHVREAVARLLPAAAVTLADGGHTSPHEDPLATIRALRELIDRTDEASRR